MKQADLKDADDATHRKGFATFEDYVQELRREAWRWKGDVDGTRSTRVKGVTRKNRKATGAPVYEARYTKVGLASFGTFETEAEAVEAFDIGTILVYGTKEKSLNEPLTRYMVDGKFKEGTDVLKFPRVIESVQGFLNSIPTGDKMSDHLSRIRSYFSAETCPFYDARNMS